MISNNTFRQTHDLGLWSCKTKTSFERFITNHKMHPNKEENIHVKVNESTQFKLYPINSSSVTPDLTTPLAFTKDKDPEEIYEGLFKTKTLQLTDFLLLMLMPARTHTFKDLCLDTAAPFTRRSLANQENVIELVKALFIDIVTFALRLLSSLPRAAYNFCYAQQHPLKGAFNKDVDAVYVKCKKTWKIEGEFCEKLSENRPEKITNEHTSTFFWRIDLQPALHNRFEFENESYSLEKDYANRITGGGIRHVFVPTSLNDYSDSFKRTQFCVDHISSKCNEIRTEPIRCNPHIPTNNILLSTQLQKIVIAPEVAHI